MGTRWYMWVRSTQPPSTFEIHNVMKQFVKELSSTKLTGSLSAAFSFLVRLARFWQQWKLATSLEKLASSIWTGSTSKLYLRYNHMDKHSNKFTLYCLPCPDGQLTCDQLVTRSCSACRERTSCQLWRITQTPAWVVCPSLGSTHFRLILYHIHPYKMRERKNTTWYYH